MISRLSCSYVRYYSMSMFHQQSPCSSNPCMNGATCTAKYRDDDYECICSTVFMGKHCEIGTLKITFFGFSLQSEKPAKSASLSIPGWGMVRVINSVQVCVFVLNHGLKQDVLKLSNMGGGGEEGGKGRNNIVCTIR